MPKPAALQGGDGLLTRNRIQLYRSLPLVHPVAHHNLEVLAGLCHWLENAREDARLMLDHPSPVPDRLDRHCHM